MKTRKLRLTAIILFCVLLLGAFVGCAGKQYDPGSNGSTETSDIKPPPIGTNTEEISQSVPAVSIVPPIIEDGYYDDRNSSYGYSDRVCYNTILENCGMLDSLIVSDGHNVSETANRFFGWSGYKAEWEYDYELPGLYQYIVWYSRTYRPITKEEVEECNNARLSYPYPEQSMLTQHEIDIMFTFDEDLIKKELHTLDSFYFENKLYSFKEMRMLQDRTIPTDVLLRMKDSEELMSYCYDLVRAGKESYIPDILNFFETLE